MSATSELQEQCKMTRKSSFNQRCSLLSQYLKEKGSFGDLALAFEQNAAQTERKLRPVATTMDLFPVAEKHGQASILTKSVSMDLFPTEDNLPKMSDWSTNKVGSNEPEATQMTIFYGGQVIVFNDFPADKAKTVMELASKTSLKNPGSNMAQKGTTTECTYQFGEPVPPRACLPLAPPTPLRRFLEKRKDRLTAKAPYLVSSPAERERESSGTMPWLGSSAQ